MSKTRWEINGKEFVNCNCDYGCPCQFNALPTDGTCRGVGAIAIESGYYGKTKLDGLNAAWLLDWPNPIHEGNGTTQVIVDERANADQRHALVRILSGEDTEPGATVWQVFSTTMTKVLEPLFRPITFEVDVDARTARLSVPGLIDSRGEPIRNPVTGDIHRARIDLPARLRIHGRRNGLRHVQGRRRHPDVAQGQLRPVRPDPPEQCRQPARQGGVRKSARPCRSQPSKRCCATTGPSSPPVWWRRPCSPGSIS